MGNTEGSGDLVSSAEEKVLDWESGKSGVILAQFPVERE